MLLVDLEEDNISVHHQEQQHQEIRFILNENNPLKVSYIFLNTKTTTIFQFFISSIRDFLFLDGDQLVELSRLASKIINQNIFLFKRQATN